MYADDLVLIADSLENAEFGRLRESTESRGLRVNIRKMKVMINSVDSVPVSRSGV